MTVHYFRVDKSVHPDDSRLGKARQSLLQERCAWEIIESDSSDVFFPYSLSMFVYDPLFELTTSPFMWYLRALAEFSAKCGGLISNLDILI